MGCTGSKDDDGKVEAYKQSRSCTDCPMLLVFFAYWVGFVIVAGIAFKNGDPDKLLYGTDYLGYVCGRGSGPPNLADYVGNSLYQSTTWSENNKLWYPISAQNVSDLVGILEAGVCVRECPEINITLLWEAQAASFQLRDFSPDLTSIFKVYTYGYETVTGQVNPMPSFHYSFFNSAAFFHRCMPTGVQTSNFTETLAKVPGFTEVSRFFWRGTLEVFASWRVFIIIAFVSLVLCFFYVYVMRFIVRPLTYLVLLLVAVALFTIAWMMWQQSRKMVEQSQLHPDDLEARRYDKAWRYSAYIVWGLTGVYVLFVIWFHKRIEEAIAMIKVAGRVIASAPSMLVVPPIASIGVLFVAVWCIFVGLYIYTADNFDNGIEISIQVPDTDILPSSIRDKSYSVDINGQNVTFLNTTTTALSPDYQKRNLLFYDLFGFLWSMGLINAIGYTVIAFCTVFWYFSSLHSDQKTVPFGGMCKAFRWTLFYHLGTVAFGALIVAIVQFVRILMNYFAAKSQIIKQNSAAKCLLCIANCCLACFERFVSIVSKNAYTMMCITNKSFCCAARDALLILADNAIVITILNFIAEVVMGLGKILIVASCVMISYALMERTKLAPGVETKIFPLIVIGFMVYFIACVFFNVYSTVIDASFICFHQDLVMNRDKGIYYAPVELQKIVSDKYDQAKKAAEYEQRIKANTEPKK